MTIYDVARGTRDFLPDETVVRDHVDRIIRSTFESYGCQRVQTPIFENFGLFAARSGEEIRESMFTFVSDREEFALRPEMTAAVCRVIASGKLGNAPLPYKLYYVGECFRYCRPQAGRYREFTQAGLELMGSSSPLADAEVIAIAVKTLKRLGIDAFLLKIGNIGIFRGILQQIYPKEFEQQSRIINNIDHVMSVREKCNAINSRQKLDQDDLDYLRVETESLYRLQEEVEFSGKLEILPEQSVSEQKAREQLKRLPEVAEATHRAMWSSKAIVPAETADLLMNISRMRGDVDTVLPQAKHLLADTPVAGCLDDLALVCELLKEHGVGGFEVVLGVARGLDFYTGTVFEIDSPLLGAQKQICGGGRYDRLVEEFGGRSIPATGFAFGVDRVVEVFQRSARAKASHSVVDAFVVVVSPDSRAQGVRTAESLRGRGVRVSMDLMGLDMREQLGYAAKLGSEFAIIIGLAEIDKASCKLRQMSTRTEETVSLSAVADMLLSKKGR